MVSKLHFKDSLRDNATAMARARRPGAGAVPGRFGRLPGGKDLTGRFAQLPSLSEPIPLPRVNGGRSGG
jgi:hypothetical protein